MSDRIGSTTIVAVFGGLASDATGGDFYEGAMSAAFVHLYNELHWDKEFDDAMDKILDTDIGIKIVSALDDSKKDYYLKSPRINFLARAAYNPKTRTAVIPIGESVKVYVKDKSGKKSVATVSFDGVVLHELGHAYRHEIDKVAHYGNDEEMYVIKNYENVYTGLNRISHDKVSIFD